MAGANSSVIVKMCFGLVVLMTMGCASSYKPARDTEVLHQRLSEGGPKGDLSVSNRDVKCQIFLLVDEKVAKPNLGIVPKELDMFPIFLKIENTGQNPIKVDLLNSFIVTGKEQNPSMMVEDAVERVKKSDPQAAVGLGAVFGLFGGLAGATVGIAVGSLIDNSTVGSKTIEQHYYDNSFKPTFIFPGASGAGIVFFDIPKDRMESEQFSLSLPVLDLDTNEQAIAEILFNAKDTGQSMGKKQ